MDTENTTPRVGATGDITKIGLRSHVERRADFYDMIDVDDLIEIQDVLEAANEDGWIALFTADEWPGGVNVRSTPDVELSLSLARDATMTGEAKVLAASPTTNRAKAFALVCDVMRHHFKAEAKNGGDGYQWFTISEEDALAAFKPDAAMIVSAMAAVIPEGEFSTDRPLGTA